MNRNLMTRLFLVRHGATAATEEDRFSGASGAELSDQGRWQAARLGERLSLQDITAVYSSPLSRAGDSADYRGALVGHTLTPCGFGDRESQAAASCQQFRPRIDEVMARS